MRDTTRGTVRTEPDASPASDDPDAPAVSCRDVVREYTRGDGSLLGRSDGRSVRALDGVSLDVHPGEFVGVAGTSGSGKSTLLHLLAALDTPDAGTVRVAGRDVATLSRRERTRLRLDRVGIVFQRFHLLPALSAAANVALPLIERGVAKRRRRERASTLLETVGLADRETHRPGALSGGEQQRVAVARALATDPGLVVADEPTGELDSDTGARVIELFADLADDRGVVVASHDDQVLSGADRVVRLRDGARVA